MGDCHNTFRKYVAMDALNMNTKNYSGSKEGGCYLHYYHYHRHNPSTYHGGHVGGGVEVVRGIGRGVIEGEKSVSPPDPPPPPLQPPYIPSLSYLVLCSRGEFPHKQQTSLPCPLLFHLALPPPKPGTKRPPNPTLPFQYPKFVLLSLMSINQTTRTTTILLLFIVLLQDRIHGRPEYE